MREQNKTGKQCVRNLPSHLKLCDARIDFSAPLILPLRWRRRFEQLLAVSQQSYAMIAHVVTPNILDAQAVAVYQIQKHPENSN